MRSLFRGWSTSSCARGEESEQQRSEKRLVDAAHHHAMEESEQQRSEEEAFTILSIGRHGASPRAGEERRRADSRVARRHCTLFCRAEAGRRGASPCAVGERIAAQGGRDVHSSAEQRRVDEAMHHV